MHGYGSVTDKGFTAFLTDLEQGGWGDVPVDTYKSAEGQQLAGLAKLPADVGCKLSIVWAVQELQAALSTADPSLLAAADKEWDSAQRALYHQLNAGAEDKEPSTREAAGRLQKALLAGDGKAQTQLSYEQEVDFGRQQVSLSKQGELAEAAGKVGLAGQLARIDEATEALATLLGRAPGETTSKAPSVRRREALTACAAAFNTVHTQLSWLIKHTPPGGERDALAGMLAPFEALLARYDKASPAVATGGSAGDGEQPSAPTS